MNLWVPYLKHLNSSGACLGSPQMVTTLRANVTSVATGITTVIGGARRSPYIAAEFSLPSPLISLSLNILTSRPPSGLPRTAGVRVMKTYLPILGDSQVRPLRNVNLRENRPTRQQNRQAIVPPLIIRRDARKAAVGTITNTLGDVSSFEARTRAEVTGGSLALSLGDKLW